MGEAYQYGIGVIPDYAVAADYYRQAVDAGDAYAASNLAYLYMEGLGVEKDVDKAVELYRLSAERGNTDALRELAGYGIK